MELEELRQKWEKIDERLAKSEVYNRRMLQELLKGKNQTHYEQVRKQAVFSCTVRRQSPLKTVIMIRRKEHSLR